MANSYDLADDYGLTHIVGLEQFEVGVMNDRGFDCDLDFFIIPDNNGYPDGESGEDALFSQPGVDTSDWVSGTYPNMAWNRVDLTDYDGVWEPLPEVFYFGMHTWWDDGDFDFYTAIQSEENGALPVAWTFVNDWYPLQDSGFEPGAFAFKLLVYEVSSIQETSLGSIKAMF